MEEELVKETDTRFRGDISGTMIGLFLGFDEEGHARVDYPGNPTATPMRAQAATPITTADRGRDALLVFEGGDPAKPIVVGLMQKPQPAVPHSFSADVDNESLEFTARQRIVLRCGAASITLTKSGKVIIRGNYVLSRSSGINVVQGGMVRLN